MPESTVIKKLKQEIEDYSDTVGQKAIGAHFSFLAKIGTKLYNIDGSDIDINILKAMESVIKKIHKDMESGRHKNLDEDTLEAIGDLLDMNTGLVRGYKKDLDMSPLWSKTLRDYIKTLRNLSVAALLILSNENISPPKDTLKETQSLFNWINRI